MTTFPLTEPFRLRAALFLGDQLLATIRCRLYPSNVPVAGMAVVPDNRDWLWLGPLTLVVQRNGRQYQIVPTKLERAAGAPCLLTFDIRP
jgi:hypothetical protein